MGNNVGGVNWLSETLDFTTVTLMSHFS